MIFRFTSFLGSYENWDLEELHLIQNWKYLQTLRLIDIPIEDGEFMIEIGKQCKNLQNLELTRLGPRNKCCYEEELLQMLTNCRNLRAFLIEAVWLNKTVEVLSLLTNNEHLSRVHLKTTTGARSMSQYQYQLSLTSSIEKLLHQCPKLTTFLGEFNSTYGYTRDSQDKLLSDQQR